MRLQKFGNHISCLKRQIMGQQGKTHGILASVSPVWKADFEPPSWVPQRISDDATFHRSVPNLPQRSNDRALLLTWACCGGKLRWHFYADAADQNAPLPSTGAQFARWQQSQWGKATRQGNNW